MYVRHLYNKRLYYYRWSHGINMHVNSVKYGSMFKSNSPRNALILKPKCSYNFIPKYVDFRKENEIKYYTFSSE